MKYLFFLTLLLSNAAWAHRPAKDESSVRVFDRVEYPIAFDFGDMWVKGVLIVRWQGFVVDKGVIRITEAWRGHDGGYPFIEIELSPKELSSVTGRQTVTTKDKDLREHFKDPWTNKEPKVVFSDSISSVTLSRKSVNTIIESFKNGFYGGIAGRYLGGKEIHALWQVAMNEGQIPATFTLENSSTFLIQPKSVIDEITMTVTITPSYKPGPY
jgi:hypothetical protein